MNMTDVYANVYSDKAKDIRMQIVTELIRAAISVDSPTIDGLLADARKVFQFIEGETKAKTAYKKYSGSDKLTLAKPKKKRRYTKKSKFWGKKKVA
jgi:hypothetical protein